MATGGKVKDAAGNVGTATNLSPSLVARVTQGVRYIIKGVPDNTWFGPSQPIQPAAQEAAGRVLDYQVGYNLLQRPRQETEAVVSFRELRQLSEACNIMRLAIETRKDQIGRLAWNVKLRDTGKKTDDKKPDPRIAEIEAFFRRPDRENDWTTWLRQLIEDLLVIDAPTIYRRKDKAGRPFAFNIMDGALIKRLIDEDGLTPLPPSPAYQQILHGVAAVDYTSTDILYLPRNKRSHRLFGFSPVEQVVMMVNIAIRRSVAQLNYFTEGNIPEALISCPPEWRPQQIKEMQEIFDDMLKGNLAARSGAKFMPGGLNVQFTKDALLKDEFDEWLARIICFAFSIPPTAFVKQMNRASSQTQKESADEEGLAPLQQWVKSFMDQLLAEDFGAPDLEFVWYDDTAADPLILAQVNQIYVNTGIKTRNEVRGELGLDPIPDGDETTITTGTGVTRLSDALEPPEPAPAALAAPTDHAPPNGAAPGNPKTKDKPQSREAKQKMELGKADDPNATPADDAAPTDDKTSHEDELTAIFGTFLRRQRDRIAALIGGTEHTGQTPDGAFADAETSGVLNADALVEPVAQVLEERAVEASQAELQSVAASAGVEPETVTTASRLVNQEAVDYAHGRAAEMVGRKLVDGKLVDNPDAKYAITDTTRDGLRKLIETAEVEGKSVQQLANEIRQSALFGKDRARLIAQTELSFADSNGNLIAWKASGVVTGKKSILGNEHKLCDQCDANAKAGVIGLDAAFPSGHQCAPFHPQCLPGGSLISPCGDITATTQRWFEGDVIIILTAANHKLTITPNHPVLTSHGWVEAGLLQEGDYVVGSSFADGRSSNDGINHNHMPTSIEEVVKTFMESSGMSAVEVESSPEHFHGDGIGGKVTVVRANSQLRDGENPSFVEKLLQQDFLRADISLSSHRLGGLSDLLLGADNSPPTRSIGRQSKALPIFSAESCVSGKHRSRRTANPDACFQQSSSDHAPVDSVSTSESKFGFATQISADDLARWKLNPTAHLVTSVSRHHYSGNVFNIETESGFYLAEGLVVHNCACGTLPVIAKP